MVTAIFGNCGGALSVMQIFLILHLWRKIMLHYLLTHPMLLMKQKEVCDTSAAKFRKEAGNVDFVGTESRNNFRYY